MGREVRKSELKGAGQTIDSLRPYRKMADIINYTLGTRSGAMSNGGDMEPLHMVQDTAAAPRGCAALGKPSGILKIVALVLGIIGIILALVFATFAAIVPGFPWIVVIMIAPIASVFILLLLIIFRVRDVAC